MAYTKFGELLRILRIKHHEVMGDMAKFLGVSLPFLSAIENGKRNVPSEWISKISTYYNLTVEEQKELEQAAEESKTQYKLLTTSAGTYQRKVAMQFARAFDKMDDETAIKILEILTKGEDKR